MLVNAAIELLAEAGFSRATTAAIAARAGVTTGALHHHFPGKEQLYLAVLDELAEQSLALFRTLGASPEHSADPGRSIVRDLWSLYGSRPYWAVWEINMGYRADEAMHSRLIEHRQQTRQRMHETLQRNPHLDDLTRSVVIETLPSVLAFMRGAFLDTFFVEDDQRQQLLQELDPLIDILDARLRQARLSPGSSPPSL